MPCHNAERYVEQALRSAAEQTLPPHEIIAVNDNSSDGSAEVIRRSGVEVTLLETSFRNAAAARNYGLKRATGDWIAFLDADDYWLPEHLARAEALLRGTEDVGYTALDDYLFDDERMEKAKNLWPIAEPTSGLSHLDYVRCWESYFKFAMGPTLVRRDRFEAVGGFNESQKRRHDFEMWLRVIHDHTWSYDPVSVTVYRADTVGSISRENIPEAEWFRARALSLNAERYDLPGYRHILGKAARSAVATAITDGDRAARERAAELAWPYLSLRNKCAFAVGLRLPGLFAAVNRYRRKRLVSSAGAGGRASGGA
ncbi:glycosyltransferase family 2 protein [Mucisphaera sp.]|uniref:glycosyltransferase family 2 protein n=1 Tax=Mucisphaera sp. TaxID=2913024 RepID=UPI003D119893